MIWAVCNYDRDNFKNGEKYPVVGLNGGNFWLVNAENTITGVVISEFNNPKLWTVQPL